MKLADLIRRLSLPEAYDHPVDHVEVIQTHISVVFLAGDFVYKVKKPVELGFLDFSTLEKRERFCHEEVRLNRRLAPSVYLGVVPVVETGDGGLRFVTDGGANGGARSPVEWAVRMRRLPPELRLEAWVEEGAIRPYHVAVLARRVARFHAEADSGPGIARWGRFEVVAGNARENLEQSRGRFGAILPPELLDRLEDALERELSALRPLIEKRAEDGVPVDTHGDLHLDHVYVFSDRDPPHDVVIIDCIEFNERFRYADPVADIAFLDMDLRYHGRPDLAVVLGQAYFEAVEDREGAALLPFYSAYRAAVRAKVSGMRAADENVSGRERPESERSERGHWLLCLSLLEPPARRPGLLLVGGLPGTGKSTLAGSLAERAGFDVLSSDRTRKELTGIPPEASGADAFGAGIYTEEWNDRTYAELLGRARSRVERGRRVIVDASFREDGRRGEFLALAAELRVPARFLLLEAPRDRVRDRLLTRDPGASDADVDIYERAAKRWEAPSPATRPFTRHVDTGQSHAWSVAQSLGHLEDAGLL